MKKKTAGSSRKVRASQKARSAQATESAAAKESGAKRSKQRASKRLNWKSGSGTPWHDAIIVDRDLLRSWPNVARVELGYKERGGSLTRRMAVKIYVTEKKDLPPDQLLPKSAKVLLPIGKGLFKTRRLPTDVVWHAKAKFLATLVAPSPTASSFLNPVAGGASIATPGRSDSAGTYACLVLNQQNQTFALTAGHLFQPFEGDVTQGLQVLQPAVPPPVMPAGADARFAVTAGGFIGTAPTGGGFLDFALLAITPARAAASDPLDSGPFLRQVMPSAFVVTNRIPMTKFGAATGRTSAAFSAPVTAPTFIAGFSVTNVLEFKGTSIVAAPGDSGALAVSDAPGSRGAIIGIVFAITETTPDAPFGRVYILPFDRLTGLRPI